MCSQAMMSPTWTFEGTPRSHNEHDTTPTQDALLDNKYIDRAYHR